MGGRSLPTQYRFGVCTTFMCAFCVSQTSQTVTRTLAHPCVALASNLRGRCVRPWAPYPRLSPIGPPHAARFLTEHAGERS